MPDDNKSSGWDPTNNPWQAAALRFGAVVVTILIGVVLYVYVPGPEIKVVAIGLVGAAVLALEEFIKTK